jgi:hypothetical protein
VGHDRERLFKIRLCVGTRVLLEIKLSAAVLTALSSLVGSALYFLHGHVHLV